MHLAALSLDVNGQPVRWFTTNRWVTGEHWRPAVLIERLAASGKCFAEVREGQA